MKKLTIIALGCFVLLVSGQSGVFAMHDKSDTNQVSRVEYIGSYSSYYQSNNNNFSRKVVDFFLGRKIPQLLIRPVGIVAVDTSNYWILDQKAGEIFRISQGVGEITQFRHKPQSGFPSLVGMCKIGSDRLLFTDSRDNKLYWFTPGDRKLKQFSDTLKLERPTGIACSAITGDIWVVETAAHRIRILDQQGRVLRTIGKRGTGPGEFNFPTSIWINHQGFVFIVDALNFRIQIFSPEGKYLTLFGRQGDCTGDFARPRGVATDSHGNIYVTDALFHNVQVFNDQGRLLTYFGSQGQDKGQFWMPSGIFIDTTDHIYIADSYNSRVQVFKMVTGEGK